MKTDSLNANASVQSEQNSSLADASARYIRGEHDNAFDTLGSDVPDFGTYLFSLSTFDSQREAQEELLRRANAYDALVAEIKELLDHADFQDGQAICLTQDCEALETLLASLTSPLEEK